MDKKRERHIVRKLARMQKEYDHIKGDVAILGLNKKVNHRALEIQGRKLQGLNHKLEIMFKQYMLEMSKDDEKRMKDATLLESYINKVRGEFVGV